ncbi:MAG: alpha/beta fold hydrolase [Bradymonadaceae bacterium]|nr:alpha/beta fold hydrolase [Lujinxingiaceae bacterium]
MPHLTSPDGCKLYYETHGFDHDGEVIVLLNGMTQSTQHWSTHTRALRDQYRVLTYDARGQGQSEIGTSPLGLDQHAADLIALLDHLQVHRAHLVGFSHGARIAMGFANYASHRLLRLVLCSATARPSALARTIVRSWYEVLNRAGLEAMAWSSLPTILGEQYLSQNERLLSSIVKASVARNSREGVTALLEAMMRYPDLESLAQNVRAPTLVISATADPLVEPAGAANLAELCHGDHLLLDHVGHTIPIEAPDAFRDAVIGFIER